MRILMISTMNLERPNGGTIHFTSIAKEFRKAGNLVHGLVPNFGNLKDCQQVISDCFDQIFFSSRFLSKLIPFSQTSINGLTQIFNILTFNPKYYDCVYLRSHLLSAIVILFLRLRGFKLIITEHNGWFCDEVKTFKGSGLIYLLLKFLQIIDANLSSLIIAVVEGIKEKLVENGVEINKIAVIGNGVELDLFYPKERSAILNKLQLSPNYFYLGLISDLEPWKGTENAILAMKNIYEKCPHTRLLIVGGGRQLEDLKSKYQHLDYVIFLGEVPYYESNDYINSFDLALLPLLNLSNIGYSPIKFYAYAATGRPILASDLRGIRELEKEGFMILHEAGNNDELAQKAINLINNEVTLKNMGIKARTYAQDHFSWSIIAHNILAIIDNYNKYPD